MIVICIRI